VTRRTVIGEEYFVSDQHPTLTAQEQLIIADGNMSVVRGNPAGGGENPLTCEEKRVIAEQNLSNGVALPVTRVGGRRDRQIRIVDSARPRSSSGWEGQSDEPGTAVRQCHAGDQMMRFLSMIRVQENTGKKPSERLMMEMGKLMGEMTSAGKLLDTAGLAPTAQSKRVRLRGGKISIVDGPFTETKEVVGGYAMLKADSLEEAIALAERFVEIHVADGWEIDCEVRQVFEADFG
jgi:hypothetical protein